MPLNLPVIIASLRNTFESTRLFALQPYNDEQLCQLIQECIRTMQTEELQDLLMYICRDRTIAVLTGNDDQNNSGTSNSAATIPTAVPANPVQQNPSPYDISRLPAEHTNPPNVEPQCPKSLTAHHSQLLLTEGFGGIFPRASAPALAPAIPNQESLPQNPSRKQQNMSSKEETVLYDSPQRPDDRLPASESGEISAGSNTQEDNHHVSSVDPTVPHGPLTFVREAPGFRRPVQYPQPPKPGSSILQFNVPPGSHNQYFQPRHPGPGISQFESPPGSRYVIPTDEMGGAGMQSEGAYYDFHVV